MTTDPPCSTARSPAKADPRRDAARSTALGALLVATASVLAVAGTERAREHEDPATTAVLASGDQAAPFAPTLAPAVTPPAPGLVAAPRPRRVVVVRRSRAS